MAFIKTLPQSFRLTAKMTCPMPEFLIRAANPDDAPALSALIQFTLRTTNATDYLSEVIENVCRHFTPEQIHQKLAEREIFIGFWDTEMAGTVSFAGNRVYALYVLPAYQGQGIGARLIEHIEKRAMDGGLEELWLSSSLTARGFYEKCGYQMQNFEDWGDGDMTLLMRKSLSAGEPLKTPAG